jgi:hypothetical protein
MAALKAGDRAGPFGQQVDNLALTLISPLGTDHDYKTTHGIL